MSDGSNPPSAPRKIRVAFVSGIPTHYRRPLWEGLAEVFDADFFFIGRGTERYWSKDHSFEFGRFSVMPSRPPWRFVRTLLQGRYDCIIFGLGGRLTLLEVWFTAEALGTPYVVWTGLWEHPRTLFHQLTRPLVRRLYRSADAVVVYGPHVAATVEAESGRRERVYSAPNAVDNQAFRSFVPPERVAQLRRELEVREGSTAIFAGRLVPEKGLELLFRAVRSTESLANLLIAGSGPLESELKRLAERLGIESVVRFAGYVQNNDLAAYFDASDFLVLPSVTTRRFKEPWGLVVNEAMNRGRPVIASTAVGAVAGGLVVDHRTGLVFREGDEAALAAAIEELARDDELRAHLGAEAKRHVLDCSIEKNVGVFREAVETVLAERDREQAVSEYQ
jgi:glycosyltransferase involved in cell wall biosynthesis